MWLLEPVLLASGLGHVIGVVLGPHDDHLVSLDQGVRDVEGERRVTALVVSEQGSVEPDMGTVVHRPEVQQEAFLVGRAFQRGAAAGESSGAASAP